MMDLMDDHALPWSVERIEQAFRCCRPPACLYVSCAMGALRAVVYGCVGRPLSPNTYFGRDMAGREAILHGSRQLDAMWACSRVRRPGVFCLFVCLFVRHLFQRAGTATLWAMRRGFDAGGRDKASGCGQNNTQAGEADMAHAGRPKQARQEALASVAVAMCTRAAAAWRRDAADKAEAGGPRWQAGRLAGTSAPATGGVQRSQRGRRCSVGGADDAQGAAAGGRVSPLADRVAEALFWAAQCSRAAVQRCSSAA
jgi:hypothetical protein